MSGVFSRRGSQPPPPPPPPPAPPAAEPDPSMEDILASIRRILNDGETEGGEGAPAADAPAGTATAAEAPVAAAPTETAPPAPEVGHPAPEPASVAGTPAEGNEVFILDPAMMVTDTATETAVDSAPIASNETAAAASQSMGALKKALSERQAQVYKAHAVSLEEIVREEVRPMLKGWLDAHLPAIVERLVRTEIERVVAREML
jgi:cell pole-organizing protein PopZ